MLGQRGAYLAQGSMLTPAITAIRVWVTSLAPIAMNNSASALSYFALIQNQLRAHVGLALTMMIVIAALYLKKEPAIFSEYFQKEPS